jgi:hypothetical protein
MRVKFEIRLILPQFLTKIEPANVHKLEKSPAKADADMLRCAPLAGLMAKPPIKHSVKVAGSNPLKWIW